MNTLYIALRSRTVWTVALMFVVGGTNAIVGLVPADITSWILGALGALAVYFKLSPSQKY